NPAAAAWNASRGSTIIKVAIASMINRNRPREYKRIKGPPINLNHVYVYRVGLNPVIWSAKMGVKGWWGEWNRIDLALPWFSERAVRAAWLISESCKFFRRTGSNWICW